MPPETLVQKARGNVPVQRDRAYTGFFLALFVSGLVDDGLKGVAALLFHSRSVWISIPIYILSYVVLLALVVLIVNNVSAKPSRGPAKQ